MEFVKVKNDEFSVMAAETGKLSQIAAKNTQIATMNSVRVQCFLHVMWH